MSAVNRPRVGVAAVIKGPDNRVVLGQRKGGEKHPGAGHWGFPGGHLEYGESVTDCAVRETLEETGLVVRGVKIAGVANSVFPMAELHYITLFVVCEMLDPEQQPKLLEPEKCVGWEWKSWDDIKFMAKDMFEDKRLFSPIRNLLSDCPDFERKMDSIESL